MKKNKGLPSTALAKEGSGLVFAIILMFVILGMVVTLSSVTVLETKMSQKTKSSVGAFYNADSGVEWALYEIANGGGKSIAEVFQGGVETDGKIACFGDSSNCSIYLLNSLGNVISQANFGVSVSEVKAVRAIGAEGDETQRAIEAAVAAGGDVPSGMIAMFDTNCPTGWACVSCTANTELNGRVIRGSNTYTAAAGTYLFGTGANQIRYADLIFCKKN